MYALIDSWLLSLLGEGLLFGILSSIIKIIIAIAIAVVVAIILVVINKMFVKSKKRLMVKIAESVIKNKIIYFFSIFIFFASINMLFPKISAIGSLVMLMFVVCSAANVLLDAYTINPISRKRPIKGPVTVIKIAICIILGIIIVSVLLNQNPLILISGFGAFTAILSIVFKDALVGLVAGVQITSENMLEIGDWISIPSLGVEGEVVDIALITVKVKAFDNTTFTLPAYTFQTTAFKNWHRTITKKMRQVSYSISIDPDSIKMEGEETNLTKWRHATLEGIRKDPHLKDKFSVGVKTLGFTNGEGVPISIYFTVDIVEYDKYVEYSSVFGERTIASLKEYGLIPFQKRPSKV